MRRLLCLVFALAACGGQIVPDGATSSRSSAAEALDGGDPPLPEDGAWGTWQLLSVEQPGRARSYETAFIELDLHPDGSAFRWTCLAGAPNGIVCPYYLRVGCLAGRIELDGARWGVRFSNAAHTKTEASGEIVSEPSGDIGIDGTGAIPARAHYRRVGAASREGCIP